jgi:hypothetical protein
MLIKRFVVKNRDAHTKWLTVQCDLREWVLSINLLDGKWMAAHISGG